MCDPETGVCSECGHNTAGDIMSKITLMQSDNSVSF